MQNYQKAKIIWSLCIGIVCYGFFYTVNFHLLQKLSFAEYGDFAVSIKILAIICAFLTISKQLTLNLYMPQYEKSHRHVQKSGLALWVGKNLMLAAIVLILGILLTSFVLYLMKNKTFVLVFQEHPVQFTLFFLPVLAFFVVLSCLLLSQKNINPSLAPFVTILPSMLVVSIFALGVHTLEVSSLSTILTYFAIQIIILGLYLFLSSQYYTPNFLKNISSDEHDHWYTHSQTYWIGTFSNQTSTLLSLLALEYLSPEVLVGKYAVILLFILSYVALISPLHTYLASQLGILLHSDSKKIQQIIKLINRIQLLIVIFGISTSAVFGQTLLGYINPELSVLQPQLILAMILFGVAVITAIPLRILLHSSFHQLGLYLKISRLFLCCLFLAIFIPRYGLVGAILSDTLPMIITNIIATIVCQRALHLKTTL